MVAVGGNFSKLVDSWIKKTKLSVDLATRGVWKELYGEILARSPVKTERFRDSNRIGVGRIDKTFEPPRSVIVGRAPFPGGPKLAEGEAILNKAPLNATIYMTNNLPYAKRLEHEGYSPQAPGGIYRAAAASVQGRIGQIIRRYKRS